MEFFDWLLALRFRVHVTSFKKLQKRLFHLNQHQKCQLNLTCQEASCEQGGQKGKGAALQSAEEKTLKSCIFSFWVFYWSPLSVFLFMVYEQLLGKQGRKISDPENRH